MQGPLVPAAPRLSQCWSPSLSPHPGHAPRWRQQCASVPASVAAEVRSCQPDWRLLGATACHLLLLLLQSRSRCPFPLPPLTCRTTTQTCALRCRRPPGSSFVAAAALQRCPRRHLTLHGGAASPRLSLRSPGAGHPGRAHPRRVAPAVQRHPRSEREWRGRRPRWHQSRTGAASTRGPWGLPRVPGSPTRPEALCRVQPAECPWLWRLQLRQCSAPRGVQPLEPTRHARERVALQPRL